MVKITKVYTKSGDEGETSLAGSHRVAKDSTRIRVIGELDELNASIGFAVSSLPEEAELNSIKEDLLKIQNQLFNLGAQICVLPTDRRANTPTIRHEQIAELEKGIDTLNASLPSLSSFILPGGGEAAVRLHLARTVCRRAERAMVTLSTNEPLDGTELPYLNRLSDWLFVAARAVAKLQKKPEQLWTP